MKNKNFIRGFASLILSEGRRWLALPLVFFLLLFSVQTSAQLSISSQTNTIPAAKSDVSGDPRVAFHGPYVARIEGWPRLELRLRLDEEALNTLIDPYWLFEQQQSADQLLKPLSRPSGLSFGAGYMLGLPGPLILTPSLNFNLSGERPYQDPGLIYRSAESDSHLEFGLRMDLPLESAGSGILPSIQASILSALDEDGLGYVQRGHLGSSNLQNDRSAISVGLNLDALLSKNLTIRAGIDRLESESISASSFGIKFKVAF